MSSAIRVICQILLLLLVLNGTAVVKASNENFNSGKALLSIGDNNGMDLYITTDFKTFDKITDCSKDNAKCNNARFLPDGKYIVYRKYSSWPDVEIWTTNLETKQSQLIKKGKYITYVGWLNNNIILYGVYTKIYKYNLASKEEKVFIDPSIVGQAEVWSCDIYDNKVIFNAQAGAWDPTLDIYIGDIENGEVKNVSPLFVDSDDNRADYHPVFSKNENFVVWVRKYQKGAYNNPEWSDIWMVNTDGTNPVNLTPNTRNDISYDTKPVVSPRFYKNCF